MSTENERRMERERQIVRKCIRLLVAGGWFPTFVFDGEEYVKVTGETAAMSAVTAVDESTITFSKMGRRNHGVKIILGNGNDVISDYNCGDEEFNSLMDAVNEYTNSLAEINL
jgi:hypothetical protein